MFHKNICSEVVANGFCVGCGICSAVCPIQCLTIQENSYGELVAVSNNCLCPPRCNVCLQVCPFYSSKDGMVVQNETSLSSKLFEGYQGVNFDPLLGQYISTYVGAISDDESRLASASGGVATLLFKTLLLNGYVDAVVVPQAVHGRPWFEMSIVNTPKAIDQSRGSVYHGLDWSQVLREIIYGPERRYAAIGVPCVIKGLRLAQSILPKLRKRLKFAVGITCGGYRSRMFPDVLSLAFGVEPCSIRYRDNQKAKSASDFRLLMREGTKERVSYWSSLYGFLFENNYALLKACLFCDDVFAECADATFMDAWLTGYSADRRGTSLVIVRNDNINFILSSLSDEGEWNCNRISPELVAMSQRGVVLRKREKLSARIVVESEKNSYCPKKRKGLLPTPDNEAVRHARSELAAWREGREITKNFVNRCKENQGRTIRILVWLHVFKYAQVLRKYNIHIYKKQALFGLGRIFRLLRSKVQRQNQ